MLTSFGALIDLAKVQIVEEKSPSCKQLAAFFEEKAVKNSDWKEDVCQSFG